MNQTRKKTRSADSRQSTPESPLGDTARSIISILLFIHLFILFVCLSANLAPSSLQQRLLGVFQPYAQLLNFDLDGTQLFLTQASERDVDHRIEVVGKGIAGTPVEDWESISRGVRGGERLHRYQRLADTMAFFQEDEETSALIAEAVARSYMDAEGRTVAQIRCRQHKLQSWEAINSVVPAERDPNSSSYFATLYRAEVVTPAPHQIRILKRSKAALEAAPNRRAAGKIRSGRASERRGAAGARSTEIP